MNCFVSLRGHQAEAISMSVDEIASLPLVARNDKPDEGIYEMSSNKIYFWSILEEAISQQTKYFFVNIALPCKPLHGKK